MTQPATDADLDYFSAAHDGMICPPGLVRALIARIRAEQAKHGDTLLLLANTDRQLADAWQALEAIADGEGDADEIARQTIALFPKEQL